MNWYVAKIVFQIISGNGDHQPQFDEQLRLVSAEHEKEAFEKACNLGKQNQDKFMNVQKQTVQWQFINVAELNQINELTDGTELYYNIHEEANADLYIKWTNHKSALLNRADHTIC